ncbi:MAG: PBSX family phage terminase large subunit [Acutalibacter sp.]
MQVTIPRGAFNPLFRPYLTDNTHRYLILYGGAGSGKSVFAVQRFLYRLLTLPLCNILVVRAVAATNRDSTYALFRQVISKWGLSELFSCKDSDLRISCANGNSVIFKGLDDTEKLKSITFPKGELTDIWIEEASEILEEDFNQLDVRLRGKGAHKQMVLTFNPVSVLHWLKLRFFDRKDPRALVLKSTYKDNQFLDEDYKRTLEGYKDTDPYYYSVYCLGEWGVLGQTIFDAQKVSERLSQLAGPVTRGEFTFATWYSPEANEVLIDDSTIRWVEMDTGPIQIYHEPAPGGAYVIGADTAGEGSDFNVGQVIDHITGQQVCTIRGQMDEDLFAKQLYCLGKHYHTALVSIEANFSSYPIRELERLRYPRQYVRQAEDSFTHRIRQSYGFKTSSVTRPLVIAGLVEVVREHPEWLNDRDTLNEMLTFVRNENGRPEAQEGAHDDCVMSLGIAYYTRGRSAPAQGDGGDSPFVSVGRGAAL